VANQLVVNQEHETSFIPFAGKDMIRLSVQMIKDFICNPTKTGKVCDDRQAVKFMMLCKARGLNPFEGDAFLIGYDGKEGPEFSLITAHQAFLKRAEAHPAFDGMDSGVIVRLENGDIVDREGDLTLETDFILGGWAIVYRKDRTHPAKRRLKLATFSTGYSRWKADPAGMIVKCAEADALRSSFPTTLAGMYLQEMKELASDDIVVASEPPKPPIGRHKATSNGQKKPEPVKEPTPAVKEAIQDQDFAKAGGTKFVPAAKAPEPLPDTDVETPVQEEPKLAEGEIPNESSDDADLELVREIRKAIKDATGPLGMNSIEQRLRDNEVELGSQCAPLWDEFTAKLRGFKSLKPAKGGAA
jgi:phage recombination protein Bet